MESPNNREDGAATIHVWSPNEASSFWNGLHLIEFLP